MSSEAYAKEWAFVHDLNRRFGIEPTDRKIGLRGVPFLRANEGVYSQLNPVYRELQLSPFHLTEAVVNSLKKKILISNLSTYTVIHPQFQSWLGLPLGMLGANLSILKVFS